MLVDDRLLLMSAESVAKLSNDKSTQIGALIVRGNEIIEAGWNHIPNEVIDTPERHIRPGKYRFFEHAERDAIYRCARLGKSVDGATLYLSKWFPCSDCARAIIASGIVRVFAERLASIPAHWIEDIKVSSEMLNEAGITMELR